MNDRRDDNRDPRPEGGGRDPNRKVILKKEPPRYGRATKTLAFWIVLILLFLVVFHTVYNDQGREAQIIYTDFLRQVDDGNIKTLRMVDQEVRGELESPATTDFQGISQGYTRFKVTIPRQDEGLMQRIRDRNPNARISVGVPGTNWTQILFAWLPILLILGIWIFIMRQMQSGGNRAFTFGKSKARLLTGGDRPKITFDDVAGADEAKQELQEIIEFLREPAKFQKLGGKIPKGALLLGSPGTGKTLLAKAVAGEAGVPFFSMSGSDFVEMFVGVGASVTGDTPVLIRRDGHAKLMPIAEFVDGLYEGDAEGSVIPLEGVETLGFDELDSKFKGSSKTFVKGSAWKRVRGAYRHRVNRIYEIHHLGGVLRTTGDHSVFVRTRNGVKPIPASELRPGDVLAGLPLKVRGEFMKSRPTPHSTRLHSFDTLQSRGMLAVYEGDEAHRERYVFALAQQGLMSQASIGAHLGVSQMTVSNWQRGIREPQSISARLRPTRLPEHVAITPGLMKLFGYYTAEGRENGCLEFTFGTLESDLHADVIRLMKDIFDVEPKIQHTQDNSTKLTYHVSALGRFFERHCGTGSHEKHVPEILWDLSREHFEAFLTGYALGDGYVSKEGKLSMTSVSHQLMLELRWLCAMHGIPSGLRKVHMKAGRILKRRPLPATEAWNLIIGKTSHGIVRVPANQGKRAIVRKVVEREFDGFVYDLCGCDNEAFFGGEKPILLHNSRVRDLFEQGRKNAPCIIFIDEIDAVGRHRGAGLGGGHDEREQTLNQLLVEMDGFDSSDGVILIAATNRPDVLDPALLRPGRFDRQIVVDMPDVKGRLGILKVHARPIPLEETVELEKIARGTPGFSGADLANVMNEAALLAARRNRDRVTMGDLLDAKDKVAMGAERRSLIINEKEKEVIAYHEAGHALVATLVPGADPIEKVTIVPRGRSLGATYQLPVDERHNLGRDYLLGKIAIIMGGRVAEEIVFHEITNGAKGDIDMATHLARRMVCEWGMSDRLGPIALGRPDEEVFLGREIMQNRHVSEETSEAIDAEVRNIIESSKERAHDILTTNRAALDSLAVALLERETLDEHEVQLLATGSPLPVLDRPVPVDSERAAPVRPVEEAASG